MQRLIAVICAGIAAIALPANAAEIMPHRAVYTQVFIPLDTDSVPGDEASPETDGDAAASPESGNAQGDALPPPTMILEVRETCTAWVTTERWESQSRAPDGSTAYMRSETVTTESKDGLSLQIQYGSVDNMQTSGEERVTENWTRSFQRASPTAETTVEPPQACEGAPAEDTPDGALPRLFPMAYTRVLLDGLAAGRHMFIRPDPEPCATWTVETENEPPYPPPSFSALAGQPHWNLERTFIPERVRYASEHYGITANGVITHMGGVSRDGSNYWSLSALTLLPPAACPATAPERPE